MFKIKKTYTMAKLCIALICLLPILGYSQVAVTGVSLDNPSVTLQVLANIQLKATVAPANATNTTVTWTTSNAQVAFVNNNGLVFGISVGTATITATTADGGHLATCIVTVSKQSVNEYNAVYMTTNFVVPLVRFNILEKGSQNTAIGNVALFNSVGAGINFGYGTLTETTDAATGEKDQVFSNKIGLQIGVLFAANANAGNNANVFAPTLSLSFLNFQIGGGYELGTVGTGETRFFATVAYGIPLAKLVDGGYWRLWKQKQPKKQDNQQQPAARPRFSIL